MARGAPLCAACAACAAALALGVSGPARAQPAPGPAPAPQPALSMDACAKVYEGAQQLLHAGALIRSRAELHACEAACPAALAKDCQAWHADVERQIPSLRVSAKVADGSDPGVLRVLVDGAPVAEPVAGALLDVDPGKHVLTFETPTRARVDVRVDVPVGRKGYAVDVRFPPVPVPGPAPAPPAPRRSPPVAPLVLGSLGLAGLGVGAILGIKGQLDRTHLVDTCAPHCQQSAVDAINQEWTVGALVGAGGGVVGLAGALFWALQGRPADPPAALTPVVGPRSIALSGRF